MDWKYLTAEGMGDVLPDRQKRRDYIKNKILDQFAAWGYERIGTPEIEFADVFLEGRFVPQEALYKFSDTKGRLLALRYDNTIPVARMVATAARRLPVPLRLSYMGTMFRAGDGERRPSQLFEQAGVELIGQPGAAGDGELICLAIQCLLDMGITDFQISVNNCSFFKALAEEFSLPESQLDELSQTLDGREFVRLENLNAQAGFPENAYALFLSMMQSDGQREVITAVRPQVKSPAALAALEELDKLLSYIEAWGLERFVRIDLGLLKNLSYYTGLIFRAYAAKASAAVLSGGRYDHVCRFFGRDLPASGFSLNLELLEKALADTPFEALESSPTELFYESSSMRRAFKLASELRAKGQAIILNELDNTATRERLQRMECNQGKYLLIADQGDR